MNISLGHVGRNTASTLPIQAGATALTEPAAGMAPAAGIDLAASAILILTAGDGDIRSSRIAPGPARGHRNPVRTGIFRSTDTWGVGFG